MAAAPIFIGNREVSSRGSLRSEFGAFSISDVDVTVETKLGRIIYFRVVGVVAGGEDRNAIMYYNSKTASAVEDDPGFVTIVEAGLADSVYAYQAIGY